MVNRNEPPIQRIVWRLRAMYFFFYAGMGSLLPYLSPFFSSRGISPSVIGLLLSIQPLVGSVVPPLWGGLADRTHRTMPLLRLQFIALPVLVTLLFQTHGLVALIVSLAILSTFLTAVTPLLDHVVMGYVHVDKLDYGRIRVFGSLGFSFANVCMGIFLISHPIHELYWIYVPALLGALVIAFVTRERHEDLEVPIEATMNAVVPTLPDTSTVPSSSRSQAWRPLSGFFIMLLVFSLTVPAYGSFYPLYILVNHLPAWLTSLSFSLSSGSEILTMPFA
ncbi:MAG: MFS transporter, partial [Firmicutes bacterium]|nr:MFS transporter [Bacillota bacterium]